MDWFNVVTTTVLTALTGIMITGVKVMLKLFKTFKSSTKAIIRDRIVQAHDYHIKKGSIGKYSLATVEELYTEYHALHGNGFVDGMMKDIRELDVK